MDLWLVEPRHLVQIADMVETGVITRRTGKDLLSLWILRGQLLRSINRSREEEEK